MKSFIQFFLYVSLVTCINSCIGEDIIDDTVEPELRINNPLESLKVNDTYQFEATYLNNVGQVEIADVLWSSSDEMVIDIDQNSGFATALSMGSATIFASVNAESFSYIASNDLLVDEQTVIQIDQRSGTIESTSSYTLRGDFTLEELDNGDIKLQLSDNYKASASLPGLYVYLTNNPNSIEAAYEIGETSSFEGAHDYTISQGEVELTEFDYLLYWCKPFSVKVGGGDIE